MVRRSSKLTILWLCVDMGKDISSKFVGEAMVLPITLACLRLIGSMHPMYYSVAYGHASEALLSMLVFCCLGGFIKCLLVENVLIILVWRSYKGLVFWELESMWVSHRPH